MKVIFAGFPKTGTKTINAALTELGYNCYDYIENCQYLGDDWLKILNDGATTEDFRRMFQNVDAVMDIPACFFWEEIHQAFPEAKIIFCQRESEDIWWRSFKKQIESNNKLILKLMHLLSPSFAMIDRWGARICQLTLGWEFKRPLFSDVKYNEFLSRKFYRLHNSYFFQNAPMDQVLMIDFSKGWEPLCDFLGVAVPSTPFPHKNKNATMLKDMLETNPLMIRMKHEMMVSSFCIVCTLGYGVYKLATRPSTAPSLLSYATSTVDYVLEKFGVTNT